MPAKIAVKLVDPFSDDAALLRNRMGAELFERYQAKGVDPLLPTVFSRPTGAFLVVSLSGLPVGCGAYRVLEAEVAEIRSMYVLPDYRRLGFASRLLAELELCISIDDFKVIRLETGTLQPEAISLYESSGYSRIQSYGIHKTNPRSICFEKNLSK